MKPLKVPAVLLTVALLLGLVAWVYVTSPSTSAAADISTGSQVSPGSDQTTAPPRVKPKTVKPTKPTTPTTVAAPVVQTPQGYANALFGDWTRRDRIAAARVASAAVVTTLFRSFWHATNGWVSQGCTGAAGSTVCTWARTGRHLVMQVRNATAALPLLVVSARVSR
jgi:hypothetical protein